MKNFIFLKFNIIFCSFFLFNTSGLIAKSQIKSFSGDVEEENTVKVIRNIRYGNEPKKIEQDSSSDRILDLYIPNEEKEKLPVFIFIHGGGFRGGDKGSTQSFCSKISAHGFVVVSINYYLTLKYEKVAGVSCSAYMAHGLPKRGFHPLLQQSIKNASGDVQLAFKWIKRNAKKYNLDLSAVFISGGSAGAMTALYTAYVSNQKILPIDAVVNLWGGLEDPGYIENGAPPLLTYHGDQDKLIHINFAHALHERMDEINNDKSEIHILEGKGHAQYHYITKYKVEEIVAFLKATKK